MNRASIPENELIPHRWYVGRGRNANVALWDGQTFLTIGFRFKSPTVKDEGLYCAQDGCFQPFLLIDEGVVVESVGTDLGWDRHYAKVLDI